MKEKNEKGYISRVERNSPKNRRKRNVKKLKKKGVRLLKQFIKSTFKNIVYFIVGLVYATYLLIRAFENLIVKLFMKLPRWSRAIIIWALVISYINDNFDLKVLAQETTINTIKQNPQETTIIPTEITQNETKPIEEGKCTLEHETACKIKNKAEEYNIDWRIAVSISAWETGHWTSNLYHKKNNIGGLYCGEFLSYNSLDEGIDAFVSNLKRNYFDIGLNTIELIGAKYCPIGAANDPNGLNKNWVPGVTKIYNSLEG